MVDPIKEISMYSKLTNLCTKSIFRPPVNIKSVDAALKIKAQSPDKRLQPKLESSWDKAIQKIKVGHFAGIVLGGIGILSLYLAKTMKDTFLETLFKGSGPTGVFGGIVAFLVATFGSNEYESSVKEIIDEYVNRITVDKDGNTVTRDGVPDLKCPSLDEVVLPQEHKDDLFGAMLLTQEEGVGGAFAFKGITRCGKTMSAKALARELAKRSPTGKAQFWFASEAAMKRNLADDFGVNLFGETISQRIDRILGNAILEKDPVVIVLDEGHHLLGYERHGSERGNLNSPHARSGMSSAFGKILSEKLRTKKCANVYLVITANSSAEEMSAHMKGRMDSDLFYDRPGETERKELIKLYLKEALEKHSDKLKGLKPSNFTDKDFEKLAEIGTVNLLKQYDKKSEKSAISEAKAAGFAGRIEMLRKRPMLHAEQIEKAVKTCVVRYISDGCKGRNKLYDMLRTSLEKNLSRELEERRWEGELQYYFGNRNAPKVSVAA